MSEASTKLLSLSEVRLSFAGVVALDDVSIEVEAGSLVAVIGPNGAGKTSLFNVVSGVYKPQQGQVHFKGRELTPLAPHQIASLGVARMFQNLALFERMTVLDNMQLGRHHLFRSTWLEDLLGVGRARSEELRHREKVEAIIDFLDLEAHRKSPVGTLPYGILKRVELGRALCMEPELLLLDEPAAGLNQEETEDLARYVLDIKEELGITQLLIEHELHFVLDLADRICVLDFGALIAEGTPEEIRRDPRVAEAYVGHALDLAEEGSP